ncbi:MAG: uracil-DNA glycosylase [Deltaproteobacteria bacterium]|nr:MAG: uracil-DNA glycosylase [Deltaproteobacteria bacterium]
MARAPARAAGAPGETLEQIRADLGACERCPLHAGRRNIVFGVGSPVAELMLIGEGPGQHEDLTGEPFVGRSGQLLTRMLGAIGLERGEVYIANVVKCRPPGNRDPEPHEVATCSPYLHRQIQAIRPRVIMTLGRFAAQSIVGIEGSLGDLRRELRSYQQIPVVATYHPAYLLRTPAAKRKAWEDLLKVRALLRGA